MSYRAAVLIIGSLRWDLTPRRVTWRAERLDVDRALGVRVPIYYGRQSERDGDRRGTYTMTLACGKSVDYMGGRARPSGSMHPTSR